MSHIQLHQPFKGHTQCVPMRFHPLVRLIITKQMILDFTNKTIFTIRIILLYMVKESVNIYSFHKHTYKSGLSEPMARDAS